MTEHKNCVDTGKSTMTWILNNENKNYIDQDDSDEEDDYYQAE